MTKEAFPLRQIDLRGTPCPLNFVRCSLAIERLSPNDSLQVEIDRGEPEQMVISGLQREGHLVEIIQTNSRWVKLKIICGIG